MRDERVEQARRSGRRKQVKAAAAFLRSDGVQANYAGLRGHDVAMKFAAALDAVAEDRDPTEYLVQAAALITHGPDGPRDPRRPKERLIGDY